MFTTIFIYSLGFLLVFFDKEITEYFNSYILFKKPLIALFFCFIIIEQTYSNRSAFKLRKFKLLDLLGKTSYGIYLLHMVAIQVVFALKSFYNINIPLQILIALFLTFLFSFISYFYFESFFLKIKKKFV